jgi:hypothetical protein
VLALALSLCGGAAFAQGVVHFNWVADTSPQIFQGSFDQGGPFTIISPDHTWGPGLVVVGITPGNVATFRDPTFPGRVLIMGMTTIGLTTGISEGPPIGDLPAWTEYGHWVAVPEPSAFGLLALGLVALFSKKAISRN